MSAVADLATLKPAEIDARLAELWKAEQTARLHALRYRNYAADPRHRANAERYAETAENYETEADQARALAEPFTAEFTRRGGWRRYFLVANDTGHVHRGMDCSTCRQSTEYTWLIDLADADEAALVAEWGEKACTVCFPGAPTYKGYGDGTSAYARRSAAEAEEAAKAKAKAAAEKAAKAITAPGGGPLRVGGYVIKTKVAAQRELSGRVKDYAWYGPTHPSDFAAQIEALVEALEAAGIETAPIIERAKRAVAREGATHVYPVNKAEES